jgi:hypothetical protein
MNEKKAKHLRRVARDICNTLSLPSETSYVMKTRLVTGPVGEFISRVTGEREIVQVELPDTTRLKPSCARYYYKKLKQQEAV